MAWQEIIVSTIAIFTLVYLAAHFRKQAKSRQCDECGLMEMKKKGIFWA